MPRTSPNGRPRPRSQVNQVPGEPSGPSLGITSPQPELELAPPDGELQGVVQAGAGPRPRVDPEHRRDVPAGLPGLQLEPAEVIRRVPVSGDALACFPRAVCALDVRQAVPDLLAGAHQIASAS